MEYEFAFCKQYTCNNLSKQGSILTKLKELYFLWFGARPDSLGPVLKTWAHQAHPYCSWFQTQSCLNACPLPANCKGSRLAGISHTPALLGINVLMFQYSCRGGLLTKGEVCRVPTFLKIQGFFSFSKHPNACFFPSTSSSGQDGNHV